MGVPALLPGSAVDADAPSVCTRPCALLLALCLLAYWLFVPPMEPPAAAIFPVAQFGTRPLGGAAAAAGASAAPAAAGASAAVRHSVLQGLEAALLRACDAEAHRLHCSNYLAPLEPHEWSTPCDAACAAAELDASAWNFGARRVVDLTGGAGGLFSAAAQGTPGLLTQASLLRGPQEAPGSVALAVLATRALAELAGEPALFLLPTLAAEERRGAAPPPARPGAPSGPPPWVLEDLAALPPPLRIAAQDAYLMGLEALLAALSTPAALLGALLPALAPAGSATPKRSSVLLMLPPGHAAGGEHSALGASDLNGLRALVCAMAPGWSLEVQAGHLRVYAPLRAYTVPPRQLPPALWAEFTQDGAMPVRNIYSNQASLPGGEPITVTYDNGTIAILLWKAGRREQEYYGVTDSWLYSLLDRHPTLLAGKRVAILGSLEPWYECVALTYGVKTIYTVEYGARHSEDPRFRFITPAKMEAEVAAGTWEPFDVAFSISSFEHDGLGRYGDPLNGAGDLTTMDFVRRHVVRPGGHLLFAVPMGGECVTFNLQRIYGPNRLALVTKGWKQVDSEGLDWSRVAASGVCDAWYQPVLLLQNPSVEEGEEGGEAAALAGKRGAAGS